MILFNKNRKIKSGRKCNSVTGFFRREGGLARDSASLCMSDGRIGGNYQFAIGTFAPYRGGTIPGPTRTDPPKSINLKEVILSVIIQE